LRHESYEPHLAIASAMQHLAARVLTNLPPYGTVHSVYDRAGNLIAEGNGTGVAGISREYIWLPGTQIAPIMRTTGVRHLRIVSA
jgi:hypothetical protein